MNDAFKDYILFLTMSFIFKFLRNKTEDIMHCIPLLHWQHKFIPMCFYINGKNRGRIKFLDANKKNKYYETLGVN